MRFPFWGNTFPYTKYNEVNLDWILKELGIIKEKENQLDEAVQSAAESAEAASDYEADAQAAKLEASEAAQSALEQASAASESATNAAASVTAAQEAAATAAVDAAAAAVAAVDSALSEKVERAEDAATRAETAGDNVEAALSNYVRRSELLNLQMPVGYLYLSVAPNDPATLFGGVWERLEDVFLLASGPQHPAGSFGGAETHVLTVDEIPSHTHGRKTLSGTFTLRGLLNALNWGPFGGMVSRVEGDRYTSGVTTTVADTQTYNYTIDAGHEHDAVGGGQAHNNMPPFIAVYCWRRVS